MAEAGTWRRTLAAARLAALLATAAPVATVSGQVPDTIHTQADAVAALRSGDIGARSRAIAFADRLGWRASPEFKAAVIEAAWQYMRGDAPQADANATEYDDHEEVFEWFEAVIRTHDPAGIPFLVEHAIGNGNRVTNALADFGQVALAAVLEASEQGPIGVVRVNSTVQGALQTLRYLVEDGSIDATYRPQAIAAARQRLTEGPHDYGVVRNAMELALVLQDPELLELLERLALDPAVMVDLLGTAQVEGRDAVFPDAPLVLEMQIHARGLLAGTIQPGGRRKRCWDGDCPP